MLMRSNPAAATPSPALQLQLPSGQLIGPLGAPVRVQLNHWSSLGRLRAAKVGALAEDYVEGRLQLEGSMRQIMAATAAMVPPHAVQSKTPVWTALLQRMRSLAMHTRQRDAAQIEHHYDVGDDFYALWLDPRRVYSCAYYRQAKMNLAQAQEAKLEHICRKLMLRSGERFLDIGAGWGALLLWSAEHYEVQATGITLSRQQHAHVQRLIEEKGLQNRVQVHLLDYRDLNESQSYDKIASVGMFEHVGRARLPEYFGKIKRLLRPGGLLMNHGITAGGTQHHQLGAGMGDFIEKYIFPGGELLHTSAVLAAMADAGLEMVDTENLRPHYARTLWAWSDALEAKLDRAQAVLSARLGKDKGEKVLRAYRIYLAGCAMGFEQGWIALHQMLAVKPSGQVNAVELPGSQSDYPFSRDHIYLPAASA
jgi:cyclopropane-fatty-acyl-phospholipid synthase